MQSLIPWVTACFLDVFVLCFFFAFFFLSITFDIMCSLATITAYDLICKAFSIIIFLLCSISRSSFAFCLFPLCEFAFALIVMAYFLQYFHVFPMPWWWTFFMPALHSILYRTLYPFHFIETEFTQVLWLFWFGCIVIP